MILGGFKCTKSSARRCFPPKRRNLQQTRAKRILLSAWYFMTLYQHKRGRGMAPQALRGGAPPQTAVVGTRGGRIGSVPRWKDRARARFR